MGIAGIVAQLSQWSLQKRGKEKSVVSVRDELYQEITITTKSDIHPGQKLWAESRTKFRSIGMAGKIGGTVSQTVE
jgi:hypothetical protein